MAGQGKYTHEEIMQKYGFTGLRVASWEPQTYTLAVPGRQTVVSHQAIRRPAPAVYKYIIPQTPKLPEATDDEESEDEVDEEAAPIEDDIAVPPPAPVDPVENILKSILVQSSTPVEDVAELETPVSPVSESKPKKKSKSAGSAWSAWTKPSSRSKKPSKSASSSKAEAVASAAAPGTDISMLSTAIIDESDAHTPAAEALTLPEASADDILAALLTPPPDTVPADDEMAIVEIIEHVPRPETTPEQPDSVASIGADTVNTEDVLVIDADPVDIEEILVIDALPSDATVVDVPVVDAPLDTEEAIDITSAMDEKSMIEASDAEVSIDALQDDPLAALLGELTAPPLVASVQPSQDPLADLLAGIDVAEVDDVPQPIVEPVAASQSNEEASAQLEPTLTVEDSDVVFVDEPTTPIQADDASIATSVASEDKHVSFAPGTPEPKPTIRKKKHSRDTNRKRRSSITNNDALKELSNVPPASSEEAEVAKTTIQPEMSVEDPAVGDDAIAATPEDRAAASAKKTEKGRPRSSSKSTGLFAGGLLAFGSKQKLKTKDKDKKKKVGAQGLHAEDETAEAAIGLGIEVIPETTGVEPASQDAVELAIPLPAEPTQEEVIMLDRVQPEADASIDAEPITDVVVESQEPAVVDQGQDTNDMLAALLDDESATLFAPREALSNHGPDQESNDRPLEAQEDGIEEAITIEQLVVSPSSAVTTDIDLDDLLKGLGDDLQPVAASVDEAGVITSTKQPAVEDAVTDRNPESTMPATDIEIPGRPEDDSIDPEEAVGIEDDVGIVAASDDSQVTLQEADIAIQTVDVDSNELDKIIDFTPSPVDSGAVLHEDDVAGSLLATDDVDMRASAIPYDSVDDDGSSDHALKTAIATIAQGPSIDTDTDTAEPLPSNELKTATLSVDEAILSAVQGPSIKLETAQESLPASTEEPAEQDALFVLEQIADSPQMDESMTIAADIVNDNSPASAQDEPDDTQQEQLMSVETELPTEPFPDISQADTLDEADEGIFMIEEATQEPSVDTIPAFESSALNVVSGTDAQESDIPIVQEESCMKPDVPILGDGDAVSTIPPNSEPTQPEADCRQQQNTSDVKTAAMPDEAKLNMEEAVAKTVSAAEPVNVEVVTPEALLTEIVTPSSPTTSRTSRRHRSDRDSKARSSRKPSSTDKDRSAEVRSRRSEDDSERRRKRESRRIEELPKVKEDTRSIDSDDEEHRRIMREARRAAKKAREAEETARLAREEADANVREAEARRRRREQRSEAFAPEKSRPSLRTIGLLAAFTSSQSMSKTSASAKTSDRERKDKRSSRDGESSRRERSSKEGETSKRSRPSSTRSVHSDREQERSSRRDAELSERGNRRAEKASEDVARPASKAGEAAGQEDNAKERRHRSERAEVERLRRTHRTSERPALRTSPESNRQSFLGGLFRK